MNRAQRRKQAKIDKKIHKIALQRTKAFARKTAKTPLQGEIDVMSLNMAFNPANWHPESAMGIALTNLMQQFD
ncbi:MAG: hypothetical protein AAGF93_01695 [Cyanobacteria bacterium P01_H01_bin.105]